MKKRRIKISSAKAKSRWLQKWFCQKISDLTGIPWGKDKLIQSRPMGQSGPDVILIGDALKEFPFTCECKSAEKWSLMSAINQVRSFLYKDTDWLVVLKNKSLKSPIVVLDANVFFDILSRLEKE